MAQIVEVLVSGGKANPGPPLGPALGPLGVNIGQVVAQINEATADYTGMSVPVKVIVDDKKNVTIEVGTPPTSSLILQEVGQEKGSTETGAMFIGDLTLDQAKKIARMKKTGLLSRNMKNAVKEVLGTAVSVGVTIEGMPPKEMIAAINSGEYDEQLAEEL